MTRPRVLFVSWQDAGTARMAAAYFDHLAGDRYEGLSAGAGPSDHPGAEAVASMAEVGVAVAETPGAVVTRELTASAARVVALDCSVEEICGPVDAAVDRWGIPDVRGRPLPEVAVFRDTLRRLVERLVARMDTEAAVR